MTGPEVDAFKVRHPNVRIVDVIVYREACEVYSAGCNSVLDHSERSTPQTRQAAREAGIKALIRAGFPEDALNIVGPEHTEQAPAAMKMSNYIEQPEASQDKAVEPKNVFGQVAVKPFYIWANEDCANKSDSFKQAKAIRLALFNDGGESVHIVDADGVEVVDAEIEAHEALVNAGYYAGARKPDVKPEFPGAFMVNDPQDPDGFAIVGDDVAALILDARDHLIDPAAEREVV